MPAQSEHTKRIPGFVPVSRPLITGEQLHHYTLKVHPLSLNLALL